MSEQPTTATDANRAAELSVVAGVTAKPEKPAPRKRQPSRATKGAAKTQQPAKQQSKPAAQPAPKKTDLQKLVFAALFAAAGDICDNPPAGVSKQQAREILSARMRYTPRASELWDSRLGPKPTK